MKLFRKRETHGSRRSARMGLLRLKRFGVFIVAAAAIAGGAFYTHKTNSFGRALQWTSDRALQASADAGFRVNEILVTGRARVPQEELLQHLGVRHGMPVFGIDIDAARESLAAVSWIKTAAVSRRLPDKIVVAIEERQPAALWQWQKKLSLIDAEGNVLGTQRLGSYADLPLVVGEDARFHVVEVTALLRAEPVVARHVESAVRVGKRRWDLHLKGGLVVRLPERDTELAMSRLARAQISGGILAKDISSIDLRMPDRIVVGPVLDGDMAKKTGEKAG